MRQLLSVTRERVPGRNGRAFDYRTLNHPRLAEFGQPGIHNSLGDKRDAFVDFCKTEAVLILQQEQYLDGSATLKHPSNQRLVEPAPKFFPG